MNKINPNKVTRTGVYGVCLERGKMLLVVQRSGPFKDKFDFPGGGIEFGETAECALRREFKEEIACDFNSLTLLDNLTSILDVQCMNENECYTFYQIGLIYQIYGLKSLKNQEKGDLQYHWVELKSLSKEQCSGLLWQFTKNHLQNVTCKAIHFSSAPYQIIDLTQTLEESIPSWDGNCGYHHEIKLDYSDCADQYKFRVQQIKMDAGIGTHLDAPAHCIPNGVTVDQLPLESLIAECVVIDVSESAHERYSVSIQDIEAFENQYGKIVKGQFVMIYTGWDKFWSEPNKYHNNHLFPSVSKEAALFLLDRQIVGLGIDTLSPDRPEDGYPVHEALLGAGKYIVENVANLDKLPKVGSHIMALPIKIKGGTEAPLRLIGLIT